MKIFQNTNVKEGEMYPDAYISAGKCSGSKYYLSLISPLNFLEEWKSFECAALLNGRRARALIVEIRLGCRIQIEFRSYKYVASKTVARRFRDSQQPWQTRSYVAGGNIKANELICLDGGVVYPAKSGGAHGIAISSSINPP